MVTLLIPVQGVTGRVAKPVADANTETATETVGESEAATGAEPESVTVVTFLAPFDGQCAKV